jgi:cyclophilin family peptidyl-prolyl cis-trans isomerase
MNKWCMILWLGFVASACQTGAEASKPTKKSASRKNPVLVLETNQGAISIELDRQRAPISTENILSYARGGFYTGVIFHRVIPGFMIQAGGFDATLKRHGPLKKTIKNEAHNGLSNVRGTVAMARTQVVDSASSQFFINLGDNSRLDHRSKDSRGYGYAVFGKVIKGMKVVDKIAGQQTLCPSSKPQPCNGNLPTGMRDVPVQAVVIKKAYQRKAN